MLELGRRRLAVPSQGQERRYLLARVPPSRKPYPLPPTPSVSLPSKQQLIITLAPFFFFLPRRLPAGEYWIHTPLVAQDSLHTHFIYPVQPVLPICASCSQFGYGGLPSDRPIRSKASRSGPGFLVEPWCANPCLVGWGVVTAAAAAAAVRR